MQAVLEVVGERRGLAPPAAFEAPVDPDSEEQHRVQQLASVAEQTGAEDLFVFRLTSPGRYSHVDGTGRGAGWAGNVELDAEHEPAFAEAVSGGEPVCLGHDEKGRVFGPYYAKTAALVPHGPDAVVVLGSAGDHLAGVCAEDLVARTARAVEGHRVGAARQAAGRRARGARGGARHHRRVAPRPSRASWSRWPGSRRARSPASTAACCDRTTTRATSAWARPRLGWAPGRRREHRGDRPARATELEFPLTVQDVPAHPYLGSLRSMDGATARPRRRARRPRLGVLFVVHADSTPRGFTLLCRRLAGSVADAAEIVIRRALAAERVAESR